MGWKVHGRRTMYESDWVNVYLDDVELPDGTHIDHHVLTMPKASQTAVVLNRTEDQILLIWRHRFITDTWGWEVPAGWVEPDERSRKKLAIPSGEPSLWSSMTLSPACPPCTLLRGSRGRTRRSGYRRVKRRLLFNGIRLHRSLV